MRLPLHKECQHLQLQREIVRIFNDRESDPHRVLEPGKFKDHELANLEIGVNWDIHGLGATVFGGATCVDVKKLVEDNEKSDRQAVELEEPREEDRKLDLEVEKALDALADTDWNGYLFAVCHMEGPELRLMINPEGSVDGDDNESPDEPNSLVLALPDIETPD
ncbi:hypothetical protein V8E51_005511 [Hyaloscypha variabilis]